MRLADYMAACLLHPEHGYYTTRDALRPRRRFHHRPRNQPDVRRNDRRLAGAGLDRPGPPRPLRAGRTRPRPRHADGRHPARRARLPGMRAAAARASGRSLARAARPAGCRAGRGTRRDWHDRSPLCPMARCFWSPTSSSMPCRSASSSARATAWARTAGRSGRRRADLRPCAAAPDRSAGRVACTTRRRRRRGRRLPRPACHRRGHRRAASPVTAARRWSSTTAAGAALGDTFQALRGHARADPLAEPGTADLTAHVDFARPAPTPSHRRRGRRPR